MNESSSFDRPFGFRITALIALLIFILFCAGVIFPIELVIYLSFGWIAFLIETLPKVRPDWPAIILAVLALALFAVGLHGFLTWLRGSTSSSEMHPPHWRVAWTAALVAVVVMSFVAGVSMVGITHEVAWLATSEEPIIGSSIMAVKRLMSVNHLKQIALSAHNYHDEYSALPPGITVDAAGEALHSWQTLLLPYAENKALYDKIDLKQPWTAEEHRSAFGTVVPHYLMPYPNLPKHDRERSALSHYAANKHILAGTGVRALKDITDGTANTLLCGEAGGNYKPWGNPTNWRDPTIGLNTSKDGFGSPHPHGAQFVFADGHTAFLTDKTDPKVLRALATPAGGEPIPDY